MWITERKFYYSAQLKIDHCLEAGKQISEEKKWYKVTSLHGAIHSWKVKLMWITEAILILWITDRHI
jgi:hypothetical protein